MKALIFPAGSPDRLAPMTQWMPEALLPIANKPMVAHLLELLARSDVRQAVMAVHHMPYETESYFGRGERWGLDISYCLLKQAGNLSKVLKRAWSQIQDDVMILPANTITDLSLSALAQIHAQSQTDLTLSMVRSKAQKDKVVALTDEMPGSGALLGTAVLSVDGAMLAMAEPSIMDMTGLARQFREHGRSSVVYHTDFTMKTIESPGDYLAANQLALRGAFNGLILPGEEVRTGIRAGIGARIHPQCKLVGPASLGNSCGLSRDAVIGPDAVIGEKVVVDRGAVVENSVIFPNTYVGSHTEVQNSVIWKKSMFNVKRGVEVYVEDDIILGDMDKPFLANQLDRAFNLATGLFFTLCAFPLWGVCFLYHLVFPGKAFFQTEIRYGKYEVSNLQGAVQPRPFVHYTFQSRHWWIRKLPGLFNVIKGEMSMVGNAPLSSEQLDLLDEEWQTLRAKAPVGLFHLWEAEGQPNPSWDEQLVSEAYYAGSRTMWGDVGILLKCLMPKKRA
ncbi:nucleotidyltransferase family protein [Desulfobacter vibrioformis]|uniref:nucleotidyltransferase family protein n=1 Tax=Desulfobacter vibrioformis TaxID=34031 RepID=UPI00054F4EC3|nr:NDP-sugar synthase [Desulfobacter vibrioformis]